MNLIDDTDVNYNKNNIMHVPDNLLTFRHSERLIIY
mgnify:CR=1 FL=1